MTPPAVFLPIGARPIPTLPAVSNRAERCMAADTASGLHTSHDPKGNRLLPGHAQLQPIGFLYPPVRTRIEEKRRRLDHLQRAGRWMYRRASASNRQQLDPFDSILHDAIPLARVPVVEKIQTATKTSAFTDFPPSPHMGFAPLREFSGREVCSLNFNRASLHT